MADDERSALLRAVAADPGDDTARLAYADWLDEQDGRRVLCPGCDGRGHFGSDLGVHGVCPECRGERTYVDTSDADRATYIRDQIAITAFDTLDIKDIYVADWDAQRERKARSDRLYDKYKNRWRTAPCPACIAGIVETGSLGTESRTRLCPTCDGAGDLFRGSRVLIDEYGAARGDEDTDRLVVLHKGFPDMVTCEMRELGREECPECGGYLGLHCRADCGGDRVFSFTPSAWALAVVTTTPVTRFNPTDAGPVEIGGLFCWLPGRPERESPHFVWPAVYAEIDLPVATVATEPMGAKCAKSRVLAQRALAAAAGRFVRKYCKSHSLA